MSSPYMQPFTEIKNVAWAASTDSESIGLAPGRAFALYLDGDFVGSTITIKILVGSTYVAINDPDSNFPVTVSASAVNIMPAEMLPCAAATMVKLVSSDSETCTGKVFCIS